MFRILATRSLSKNCSNLSHFPWVSYFFSSQLFLLYIVQFSRYLSQLSLLVGTSGLEPPTSRLSGVRSNHLSYAPMAFKWLPHSFPCGFRHGGDEEDRTPDPLLAKQVLSQLSYTPIGFIHTRISGFCLPPLFPSSCLGT